MHFIYSYYITKRHFSHVVSVQFIFCTPFFKKRPTRARKAIRVCRQKKRELLYLTNVKYNIATLDPRPRLWTRDPRSATRDHQSNSQKGHRKLIFQRLRYVWHLWRDIRFSNKHVPIALSTFSNMEHYFTFPLLLSTFLTFEQNLSIFSLFGQHLSTYFYYILLVNAIFCLRKVFRKPSNSIIMNLNKSTLSPDCYHENANLLLENRGLKLWLIKLRIFMNICQEIIKNYEQLSSSIRKFHSLFQNSSTISALF